MNLSSPISEVKGVGDKTTKLFNKLGVYTVKDILLFFPRTYFSYPQIIYNLDSDMINNDVAFIGRVKSDAKIYKAKRLDVTSAIVECDSKKVELVWFRTTYVKKDIVAGKNYVFYGKLIEENNCYKLVQPKYFSQEAYEALLMTIQPIYSIVKGLTNNFIKKTVKEVMGQVRITDNRLPLELIEKYQMVDYQRAIENYHFPESYDELYKARKRLAFEELFYFILNSRLQEQQLGVQKSNFSIKDEGQINSIIDNLSFSLTNGQRLTIDDIISDLQGEYVAQRLIQGDVGCGKTIVAFLAMVLTCLNGYQAAIMAPTEVLARQHYSNFVEYCHSFGLDIPVAIFLGSQNKAQREYNDNIIMENDSCIIVGTHALISEGRQFSNLALVVTDEQHRFGVKQREALSKKGQNPHYIVMSATPIPRTLAMILYGNMHVSSIKDLPQNRLPIKTCVINENQRAIAYKFIYEQVKMGHQVYIICPLVEASETTEAENVTEYVEKIDTFFNGMFSIGMLHGKMKSDEKNKIMDSFSEHEIDILVSTTVVEVGVNVPNATVILIENANRFGLASLHQLRGRVGRGDFQSYCILMNSGHNKSKKLEVMLKSNDGFFIAAEDLKLRGPGDMFGIRQSGEFNFKVADIFEDAKELEYAALEVDNILKKDPCLSNYEDIRSMLDRFLVDQFYML